MDRVRRHVQKRSVALKLRQWHCPTGSLPAPGSGGATLSRILRRNAERSEPMSCEALTKEYAGVRAKPTLNPDLEAEMRPGRVLAPSGPGYSSPSASARIQPGWGPRVPGIVSSAVVSVASKHGWGGLIQGKAPPISTARRHQWSESKPKLDVVQERFTSVGISVGEKSRSRATDYSADLVSRLCSTVVMAELQRRTAAAQLIKNAMRDR